MATHFLHVAVMTASLLSLSFTYAQTSREEVQTFLTECANERMADIEQGQLAAERSASVYIKDYGNRMVTDHTMLLGEIRELAAAKNITLPQTLSADKAEDLQTLRKEEGEEFDYKFIRLMKVDRKRDIDLFKEAAKSADADVSAFAKKYLPMLESHLEGIKQVRKAEDQAARLASIPQD